MHNSIDSVPESSGHKGAEPEVLLSPQDSEPRRRILKRSRERTLRSSKSEGEEKEVLLEHSWTLWYDEKPEKGMESNDYESTIKKIGTFNTVQEFWRYWNNLVEPSNFPDYSNLRLFKEGIKPLWEDESNRQGGKWVLQTNRREVGNFWIHVVLAVIGEQFENSQDICGVVLSAKPTMHIISIWNKTAANRNLIESMGEHLRRLLGIPNGQHIPYKIHSGAMEFNRSFSSNRLPHQMFSSQHHQFHGVRRHSIGGMKDPRWGISNEKPQALSPAARTNSVNHINGRPLPGGRKKMSESVDASRGGSRSEDRHVEWEMREEDEGDLSDEAGNENSASGEGKSKSFTNSPFEGSPSWRGHRKSRSDSQARKGSLSTRGSSSASSSSAGNRDQRSVKGASPLRISESVAVEPVKDQSEEFTISVVSPRMPMDDESSEKARQFSRLFIRLSMVFILLLAILSYGVYFNRETFLRSQSLDFFGM